MAKYKELALETMFPDVNFILLICLEVVPKLHLDTPRKQESKRLMIIPLNSIYG